MFCIQCGKPAIKDKHFCESCFLKQHDLFTVDDFELSICSCGRYCYQKKWKEHEPLRDLIKHIIQEKIEENSKINSTHIELKKTGNGYRAMVKAKGQISEVHKVEEKTLNITIKKLKCDICSKERGNYYEAVIQVRGKNKEQIMERIKKTLPDKRGIITKIKKVRNGYDILFMSKHWSKRLINKLRDYCIKKSYKLVCEKDGKKIYRNYYSVR